jgi:hypothetical protein
VYRISGFVCEDLNEIRTSEVSRRLDSIVVKFLDAVLDAQFLL